MPREPLLLPAIVFSSGIFVAHLCQPTWLELATPAVILAVALALAMSRSVARVRPLALGSVIFLAGMAIDVWHRPGPRPELTTDDAETVILDGCVIDPPVFSPDREQFTLEVARQAAARVTVNLRDGERLPLAYGQRVEVVAKVREPHNYGNPGAFDYRAYLAHQHIFWTAGVNGRDSVQTLPGRCGWRPAGWLFAVRTWALERLERLYPGDVRTAALLQAILLGVGNGVDRQWTADFRLTGTYHALVISGQHVSALIVVLAFLLRAAGAGRIPILVSSAITAWLYAALSGMSAPVVRAAASVMLVLVAGYCFRRTRILNVLAAISLVYLAIDPSQLFDPSFQLSFLSAAAIAVFALPAIDRWTAPCARALKHFGQRTYDPKVEERAAAIRTELRLVAETIQAWTGWRLSRVELLVGIAVRGGLFIAEAVLVSACVQFGLALPMLAYFHRLSLTGLSANVIVVPLLSGVVPLGFLAIATGWHPVAALAKWLLDAAVVVSAWHVRWEPNWRVGAIPLALASAFALTLVWLAVAASRRSRWTPAPLTASLACFAVIIVQPWPADYHRGQLELTAIDVSQGDSLLVAFPAGTLMLVDAGGFPGSGRMKRRPQIDVGEDVVSPYLWYRHVKRLDYLVLTHGHSDHMDGMGAVLDNFRPRELWVGAEPDTPAWCALADHARRNHTLIRSLTSSTVLPAIDGAKLSVLAPSPEYVPGPEARNDDSLVLEVRYGQQSMLLCGDAERPVEQQLVADHQLHPITVLKVGHHGSRTSSTADFLSELRPEFALISAGYKNQFHHPHPEVTERLAALHAGILRTDQHGLVSVRLDGRRGVTLETDH